MNLPFARSIPGTAVLGAMLWMCGHSLKADGIPEPSLVIYGVVNNLAAGGSRLSFGTINWIFQPADGSAAITLSGVLTNINDQFSYVLRVPCETEIPGTGISAGTLKLTGSSSRYDRSRISIQGVAAAFVQPTQATLVLGPSDRGRIERIDLNVSIPLLLDSDGNGLPDDWERTYFGRIGIDPNDDPDHDGMSNLEEYKAGTNPPDPQSLFEFVTVSPDPSGGILIEWRSAPGKLYTAQRSGDLQAGFSDLQIHIPATAPTNSIHDATAAGSGPYFYRLRLE